MMTTRGRVGKVSLLMFQAYVHPIGPMLDAARAQGFHPADRTSGALWESVILRRS